MGRVHNLYIDINLSLVHNHAFKYNKIFTLNYCQYIFFIFFSDFGSLSQCEMLHRTNIFAIVAGGSNAKFAKNSVLIYDDVAKKFIVELVFTTPVKAVRLRRDK